MTQDNNSKKRSLYSTRREFLKTSAAAASVSTLAAAGNYAWAAGSDSLKIGLIGCGGRGTGAAGNHLGSVQGVELIAMGDAFKGRLEGSKNELKKLGEKFKVEDKNCFVGLDAYQGVLASGVDLVILATPPGFRPLHFDAAVKAGKHVFMEKPVAVDAPGIRMVMASGEMAKQKKLAVVAGTQRRHDFGYNATIKKIREGAIGELVAAQVYWNMGYLWNVARENNMTDVEWQIKNWIYFTWLSGDHYVEQHVHNLDVMNWAFGAHPVSAYGMGGRQARVEPVYGHIYDHFAVEYEFANGARVMSMARQQDGTDGNVSERIVGTKGVSDPSGNIHGENNWQYSGKRSNPYDQEHIDLVESIRSGNLLNEARTVAESTLTAIMGRMSAYSGKKVTWEQALNSQETWMPANLTMNTPMPVPPVAIPGRYVLK